MYTLALHSEVMKKAQEEVDRVVGDKRLPNFDDEADLVYVRALVKEVLRWKPPTETSIPHATVEGDEYMGYYIPNGTMVIPFSLYMQMDPKVFPNPEEFDPQRYVDNPNLPVYVFGYGRRYVHSHS